MDHLTTTLLISTQTTLYSNVSGRNDWEDLKSHQQNKRCLTWEQSMQSRHETILKSQKGIKLVLYGFRDRIKTWLGILRNQMIVWYTGKLFNRAVHNGIGCLIRKWAPHHYRCPHKNFIMQIRLNHRIGGYVHSLPTWIVYIYVILERGSHMEKRKGKWRWWWDQSLKQVWI